MKKKCSKRLIVLELIICDDPASVNQYATCQLKAAGNGSKALTYNL